MNCTACDRPAAWRIFSAYGIDAGPDETHPKMARYPAPMATVCDEHLLSTMRIDGQAFASTDCWAVMAVRP